MASNSGFEKTNFGWQIKQWQQQISEWLEARLFPAINDAIGRPNWSIPNWFWQLLTWIFWLALGLLAAWLLWQLWQFLLPYLSNIGSNVNRTSDRSNQIEPSRTYTAAEWIKRSQRFQQQGNYTEACRALYMAMLQTLNDSQIVPHQISRTDGEYLRLLQNSPQAQLYQLLIATHERLCFNGEPISSQVFADCQQAYQALNQQITSLRQS